jgi:hypothetical protein
MGKPLFEMVVFMGPFSGFGPVTDQDRPGGAKL